MWKTELLELTAKYLEKTKKKNPHFSLRALAKKCQISPGTLSDTLLQKRTMSPKIALKILPQLGLPASKQMVIAKSIYDFSSQQRRLISSNQLQLIETWHAFAILNLFSLKDKPSTYHEISKRLGISLSLVKKNISTLMALELLAIVDGRMCPTGKHWKSTDDIPSSAVHAAHVDGLKIATKALKEVPLEQRDYTSIIFPGNQKNLKKAKIAIRKFLEKLAKTMEHGELNSVYKMNIQLFPLDQWK